jgi:hypothetical protein
VNPSIVEAILAAGAIVTALVVVGRLVVNAANGIHAIQEAIGTDSEGKTLAERHEQTEAHLREMDGRVSVIEQVLSPPGQTSLPARVEKLEDDVKEVGAKVDTLTQLVKDDIQRGRE